MADTEKIEVGVHVLEKNSLVLRYSVGYANDPETGEPLYEMSLANFTTPMVRSVNTGRALQIGWDKIIEAVVASGVLEEQP